MTNKPKLNEFAKSFSELFEEIGVTFIDAETEAEFEAKAWKCYEEEELDVIEESESPLTIGEALDHLQHIFDYMGSYLSTLHEGHPMPVHKHDLSKALDKAYEHLNGIREMLGVDK